jgi:hypothetical protein
MLYRSKIKCWSFAALLTPEFLLSFEGLLHCGFVLTSDDNVSVRTLRGECEHVHLRGTEKCVVYLWMISSFSRNPACPRGLSHVLHGRSAYTYRFLIYTHKFNKGLYSLFSGSGVELEELRNVFTECESFCLTFSHGSRKQFIISHILRN